MNQRAEDLAAAVEAGAREIGTMVEAMTPDRWRATTAAEGWTVGAVTHHVAASHLSPGVVEFIIGVANGRGAPDLTLEQIHDANAHHARAHAQCNQAETLALLRTNSLAVADAIRVLSDEHLDRSAPMAFASGRPMSAEQLIQAIWIGTLGDHAASVRATG